MSIRRAYTGLALASLVSILLAGCAGYRKGWESVAYLGDRPPPARTDGAARRPPELAVPGLRLQVAIDNRLRTLDRKVVLFALPLSVNPRDVHTDSHVPGKTRVFLTVTPEDGSFVFHPAEAVLNVDDDRFAGEAGFEFAMWDEDWNRVDADGKWDHRAVGSEYSLSEPGRKYFLSIDFPTAAPSPRSPGIVLDLSQALVSPTRPAVPPIRFAPFPWSEGYT